MFNFLSFFTKDSPYVTEVKYYKPDYSVGKNPEDFNKDDLAIENILKSIVEKCKKTDYINQVEEVIFLELRDHPELKFQIKIKGKDVTLQRQWDKNIFPTLVIPLFRYNLEHFDSYMTKGTLTKEELHKVVHVLAVPAVSAFYYSELINKIPNPGFLKLHKLLHLEVKNPNNYEIEGIRLDGKVTVMNVMGQFVVLPGHVGVAPVKFLCTLDEAIEYYQLLRYEFTKAKTFSEKKKLFDKYMTLRSKTLVNNPKFDHLDN